MRHNLNFLLRTAAYTCLPNGVLCSISKPWNLDQREFDHNFLLHSLSNRQCTQQIRERRPNSNSNNNGGSKMRLSILALVGWLSVCLLLQLANGIHFICINMYGYTRQQAKRKLSDSYIVTVCCLAVSTIYHIPDHSMCVAAFGRRIFIANRFRAKGKIIIVKISGQSIKIACRLSKRHFKRAIFLLYCSFYAVIVNNLAIGGSGWRGEQGTRHQRSWSNLSVWLCEIPMQFECASEFYSPAETMLVQTNCWM